MSDTVCERTYIEHQRVTDDNDPWEDLCDAKSRDEGFRVTVLAIPGQCSADLVDRYSGADWIDFGACGYWGSNAEAAVWGYEETREKLEELEGLGYAKVFRAPGYAVNEQVEDALLDAGWALIDTIARHEQWMNDKVLRVVPDAEPGLEHEPGDVGPYVTATDLAKAGIIKSYAWTVLDRMKPGDVFMDCGAFDGEEIEVLHPRGINVVSYEPHPTYAKGLRERWNGVDGVEIVEAAVGTKNERSKLFESGLFDMGSSLCREKVGMKPGGIEVDVVRLADEVKKHKPKILKLDIEGMEWAVIEDLIESGAHEFVDEILVEDHVSRVPGLEHVRGRALALCKENDVKLGWWT